MSASSEPVFERVEATADFPAMEREILEFWERNDAFQESNRRREGNSAFVFYDGPPFATGTPHYGHLLAGTIKDIVPRFWNMRGHPVERRFGWDCHGLPIEALAQEALGLSGTGEILERGVDVFNEQCRGMVDTYVAEWRKTITRMGRWIDFDNDYKTMDVDYMESVWWVFKQLWDKDRVYKSYRIMPYSCKLATPLSNFEANKNYKDIQDPAITIRLRVVEGQASISPDLGEQAALYLTAWTTTPWTLPENLALCVGQEIPYAVVEDLESGDHLVFAEARLAAYDKTLAKALVGDSKEAQQKTGQQGEKYRLVRRVVGADLVGLRYEPVFPYYADHPDSFVVLEDGFVTTEDGTGIVHIAPAYGEDDFRICRLAGIDLVDPLDAEARFLEPVTDYKGLFCKDADKPIIRRLKQEGRLIQQSTLVHSYPFCERTDTPLIYRAIEAWYVKVEDLREDLVAINDEIGWVPEYVGSNRFGNWLREANDWNISRNRFWGSCIPVWINVDDPEDTICVGSRDELETLSGVAVDDLHKHIVDEIVIERDGKTYRRTPEVLDCWFESGSMPYAMQHYPFEHEDDFDSIFPAHFIAEGLDQTRGWFYTMLVLGTCLFGKSPYRNVIVNGMILARDGKKMSKSLKNYPDPNEILDTFGADALRAYLIDSPVVRAEELRFEEAGLKEIVRTVVLPYWNVLSFFTTYASIDGYDPRSWKAAPVAERADIDRWILSVLQSLVRDVNEEMEAYRLYTVVPRLVSFIDDLTNWYVRSSRARFWKSEDDRDKTNAYATLYSVLTTFSKVLAPFMPFLTEAVYQRLVRPVDASAPTSVHWCDYPQVETAELDAALERRMSTVRAVSTLGRRVREDHKIKVRQPLRELSVVHRDEAVRADIVASAELLANELNVKRVSVEADESAFATVTVKPNFKTLGKRCGPKLKEIGPALASWGFDEVSRLEAGESIVVAGEELRLEDVLFQRSTQGDAATATDGEYTVVLDTQLDDALRREGIARDAISLFNNARKEKGFEVSDRVRIAWACEDAEVTRSLEEHAELVSREVLATGFGPLDETSGDDEMKLAGAVLRYSIERDD
jgi:isoleucyl-tRNA synthetase